MLGSPINVVLHFLHRNRTIIQLTDLDNSITRKCSRIDGVIDKVDLFRCELTGLLECIHETGVAIVG